MRTRWILAVTSCLLLLSGCGTSRTTVRPEIYGQFEKTGPIILDTMTGLEWQVSPDRDMTWNEAREWVGSLGDSWRMPSIEKLEGLYEAGVSADFWGPFQNSGKGVWAEEFHDPSSAWLFNFFRGFPLWNDFNDPRFVRAFAVRHRTGYSPPQTSIEVEANEVVVETNIADEPGALVDGRIYGRVESSDGVPLIGATVMVVDTPWGAKTNSSGEYAIRIPVGGSYTLFARMLELGDRISPAVEVITGEEIEFNFTADNPNPKNPKGYSLYYMGPGNPFIFDRQPDIFLVSGEVISDSVSGLQWRVGPDRDMTWDEANAWVDGLGGNWRMPTWKELRALYDAGISRSNWGPFENSGLWVWSGDAYDFLFSHGHGGWHITGPAYAKRAFAVRPR